MYEIYCKLRDERHLKDADVVRETGITKSTFSDWKSGRSNPKQDKLQKIADYFSVPLEYLMGKEGLVQCPICGLEYQASNLEDCKIHQKEHKAFERATKQFGIIYPSTTYETIKSKYLNIATDINMSTEDRMNAWIEVIRAYWSRSLCGCSYDLSHPDFDKYASMILNQSTFKKRINDDYIYERLISMYGISDGIEDGKTYYKPPKSISVITSKDDRDIKKELESLRKKLSNKALGPAAFDGEDISDDDTDLFLGQVDLMLRRLKVINKEKYNPHKNKK